MLILGNVPDRGPKVKSQARQPESFGSGLLVLPGESSMSIATEIPTVFDREAALERVEGDVELLLELWGIFQEDSPRTLTELRSAVYAGDEWRVHRAAHAFKGGVANFVAPESVEAAQTLENLGRSGVIEGMRPAFIALKDAFDRLNEAMTAFEKEEA